MGENKEREAVKPYPVPSGVFLEFALQELPASNVAKAAACGPRRFPLTFASKFLSLAVKALVLSGWAGPAFGLCLQTGSRGAFNFIRECMAARFIRAR